MKKHKMKIELKRVSEDEKTILGRLIELYEYDFSEFENTDLNKLGLYGYNYLDNYWTEKNRHAFFIKADGKLAGFIMVCDYCYVSKDHDTMFLSEFFVMKKYRRLGIGEYAAKSIFNKFKGKWELTMHPGNKPSLKFWKKVVEDLVGKNYKVHKKIPHFYANSDAVAFTFEVE